SNAQFRFSSNPLVDLTIFQPFHSVRYNNPPTCNNNCHVYQISQPIMKFECQRARNKQQIYDRDASWKFLIFTPSHPRAILETNRVPADTSSDIRSLYITFYYNRARRSRPTRSRNPFIEKGRKFMKYARLLRYFGSATRKSTTHLVRFLSLQTAERRPAICLSLKNLISSIDCTPGDRYGN
ncbi:unnamed protein product, partial [Heterotrigona itama]